ncbi:MAG: uroporphyrinogen decarboxylase family protein [bacterium]
MEKMTSIERIVNILRRKPVDRVGLNESFWGETIARWQKEGYLKENESVETHFGYDYRQGGWPNVASEPEYVEQVLEETDEWRLVRNANGAHLKWWKHKAGTPEHVFFEVQDRKGWEEQIRPKLLDDSLLRKRINVEAYRNALVNSHENNIFFFINGVNVFECIHPVCGHENMLIGMALDPDWVRDMCNVYADLIIKCYEILISEGGKPDGVFFYEDMGFKGKPFMSPKMYKEIVWPAHKKTFDFAHSYDLPVVVHSCGYVEPLVPGLIEAGMDCLQAMEVKAGMDLVQLKKDYGDRIAFCGGMDIRVLETNDLSKVEEELQKKLPIAMEGSGYILHSDHSVPNTVDYKTYKYFVDRGLEIGTYK